MATPARPLAAAAFLAALLATQSAAALHRCTTADGKVTYTEFACLDGARASDVAIHDSAGMQIDRRTNDFRHVPERARAAPRPAPTKRDAPKERSPRLVEAERRELQRQIRENRERERRFELERPRPFR